MRLAEILGLASAVLLAACQPSLELTTQQRNIETSIVEDRIDEWAQAINNRELETVSGMYEESDGVVVTWPDGTRATGADGATKALTDYYNSIQFLSLGPQNVSVDVLNAQVAVATFRFSMDVVHNDTRRDPFAGQATLVWQHDREADEWRIRVQQLARNPF